MKTSSKLYAGIAAMAISLYAQAYPGESIVRNPTTGNYTITYVGNSDKTELSQTIFVPSTKIDPTIRSSFRMGGQGVITYRYTVSNGATAKQAIVDVVLEQIADPIQGEPTFPADPITRAAIDAYSAGTKAALASPPSWNGSIDRDILHIDWSPNTATFNTGGIHAGQTLSGFGFDSLDLPGVGPSWMDGLANETGAVFGFPDDGPLKDSAIFDQLNQLRKNDFITRNAAVPTIAVPTPFDPAVTLERIQTQMHTWIVSQLLDPGFSSELDRNFQSAISAYSLNQLKVGKKQIQAMRELIKKEQPDADKEEVRDDGGDDHDTNKRALIDKLAARILDFDLKYVTERTGGDKDD